MAREQAVNNRGSATLLQTRGGTLVSPAKLATCAMMAALIAVFSWASLPLPFSPVPLTLQTLAVLVAGGLLGKAWGPASVALFLLLGVVGLPVFHGGASGPGVLAGPTGGFLLGFVPAVFIMGLSADLARGVGKLGVALLAGGAMLASAVLYASGVPWLAWVTGMGLREAIVLGLLPYLAGDIVKAAAAVALIRAVNLALARQGLR
jgi:biotin transport system substrate-specific component